MYFYANSNYQIYHLRYLKEKPNMLVIGITGLSCGGKTTLCKSLRDQLGLNNCLLISMDDYFKG